jgi:hypothetical protein
LPPRGGRGLKPRSRGAPWPARSGSPPRERRGLKPRSRGAPWPARSGVAPARGARIETAVSRCALASEVGVAPAREARIGRGSSSRMIRTSLSRLRAGGRIETSIRRRARWAPALKNPRRFPRIARLNGAASPRENALLDATERPGHLSSATEVAHCHTLRSCILLAITTSPTSVQRSWRVGKRCANS